MLAERAALLGWIACGLTNATINLIYLRSGGFQKRLLHQLFDLGHFLALASLAWGAVALWRRYGPARRIYGYLALYGASSGVATLTLAEDLTPMADRVSGNLPPAAVLVGLVAAASLTIPGAVGVTELARILPPRFRWPVYALGVGLGIAAQAVSSFILQNDYPAMHLYLAWSAASLGGASLARVDWPARARAIGERLVARRFVSLGAGALVASWGLITLAVPPPISVAVKLLRNSGSVLPPYLGRLRPVEPLYEGFAGNSTEWFRRRDEAPPVLPSQPSLLPPNAVVIAVSVDALRADIANDGAYDEELPTIAKLREAGTSFDQTRAPGTKTVYTLTSLFSGTYFSQQYWTRNRELRGKKSLWPHEDEAERFPKTLTAAGVKTINLSTNDWMVEEWGVVRGFETDIWVKDRSTYAHVRTVVSRMISELSAAPKDRPLFMFTHLLDAHAPYSRGGTRGSEHERYVGELRLVDRHLGRLLAFLEKWPRADRTVLVVTSDHGEAFGEHNSTRHGTTVYDEVMRVPMIFTGPGIPARRIGEHVSMIDLGPTVMDLFGVPTPGHHMGQSLVGFFRGETPELTRPIVCETRKKRAMVFPDGIKAIIDDRNRTMEIYDLDEDPGELESLVDDETLARERLGTLEQFFAVHRIRRSGYRIPWRP